MVSSHAVPPVPPLPALPSLTSNPTFFPSTSPNPELGPSNPSSTYYPQPPTSTSQRPLPSISSSRLKPTTPSRQAALSPSTSIGGYGLSVSQSQASQAATEWEVAYERQEEERWAEKVRGDLAGWRGGHGVVRSTYSRAALPGQSYFGQDKTGIIGLHLPKEVVRIERDWSDGEVCQFETSFPMELDGRISPSVLQSLIESLNTDLTAAYSIRGAAIDNIIAVASWWTSLWWRTSTFERYLQSLEEKIRLANEEVFNPAGLNVLSPRDVALQYLEIEYY